MPQRGAIQVAGCLLESHRVWAGNRGKLGRRRLPSPPRSGGEAGSPPPGTKSGGRGRDPRPADIGSETQAGPGITETMAALLRSLLAASEKAAHIAQLCRQEEALFSLLIEEKRGAEKNKKFLQDFKTLADVLIQEVIKHDVGKEFPELEDHILGEESNKFENGLGETVVVQVCPTEQDTAVLLQKILDRNQTAADLLAAAIHQEVVLSDPAVDEVTVAIPTENLAVWIDPIDSTNQYIRGRGHVMPVDGIYPSGLRSALVLIGVYDRHSGEPVLGIINEPFSQEDPQTHRWQSKYHWGISYKGTNLSSLSQPVLRPSPRVVLSSNEKPALQKALAPLYGEQLYFASGAGYKMLCVALGLADAYVLSEGSTFKWDSCGPHAILRALGGGMVDLLLSLQAWQDGQRSQLPGLTYNKPAEGSVGAERWANQGGLVAYISQEHLEAVMATLVAAKDAF